MTKNETKLIEDWIRYHGYIFGLENIHILDGSDDKYVLDLYPKYMSLGLNVHFSSAGLNELASELTHLMHEHKGKNNFLIKLDTDEFLAYTSPFFFAYKSKLVSKLQKVCIRFERLKERKPERLLNFLVNNIYGKKKIRLENILRMFEELPITGQRYKASFVVWSLPATRTIARPCHELTRFTPLQFTHIKSFFHSASFVSVDLGCHGGKTTGSERLIDSGLTLVHYHATSVEDAIRGARRVLLSHKYIDEDDSIAEQWKKLAQLKSTPPSPFQSHHKIDLYLRHLDYLSGGKVIEPTTLYRDHGYFRQVGPPIELTLVRDTLKEIDRRQIFCDRCPERATIKQSLER